MAPHGARGRIVNDVAAPAKPLQCRDCPMWYGAEDNGWGPCSIKHQRADRRFLTHGSHECDEGYVPPPPRAVPMPQH